ncbi:MAG: tyrosine-type recombinase/integrase [Bacteriovoracaceae bacterium]|nr:tyrosine-type recombinase/integrase [Bacteriovoracaceae bacterium]
MDFFKLQKEFGDKLERIGRGLNTRRNYLHDLDCFERFMKGRHDNWNLSSFSIGDAKDYNSFLKKTYNSDNSIRRKVQVLRIFFDFLMEKSIVSTNPVRKLPTSPKVLDIPRPTPLIDIKTLWTYLLEESYSSNNLSNLLAQRNQVLMLLIYSGGLKVSDLSDLQTGQIKLGNKPRVMIKKTPRDPYTIPLPPVFTPVYKLYLHNLEVEKQKSKLEFSYVFFNANHFQILSSKLSVRGIELVFAEYREKLQIQLTPKSLRQACIFKWLHQKKEDLLIKEWMGFAPSYSLKLYKENMSSHIYNDDFLEDLFNLYSKQLAN